MADDRFPTGRFASQTRDLQRALNAGGWGPVLEDGWYGPNTEAALRRYQEALLKAPPPPVPWWKTRRAKGLLVAGVGILSTAVPAVGAVLGAVDVAMVADVVWDALNTPEQGAVIGGAAITLGGAATSIIGAWKAKAPIDPTLVGRVKGHDVRVGPTPPYWSAPRGPLTSE